MYMHLSTSYLIRICSEKNLFYKIYFHVVLDILYTFLFLHSALKSISSAIETLIFFSQQLYYCKIIVLILSFRQIRYFIIKYTPKYY